MFSLLWWLGPWMDQTKSPQNIQLQKIPVANGEFELFVYRPKNKRSTGAIYVIPGLHYEGPEDLRLDRFARVLANSGMVVGVPSLPTMKKLIMTPRVWEENIEGFQVFLQQDLPIEPGVFSISAASIVALHLASHEFLGSKIRETLTFGGYIDWNEALMFSLDGKINEQIQIPVDPLGLPVIFLNMICQFPEIQDPRLFEEQLMSFVERTWEKEEMQSKEVYEPIAQMLSKEIPLQDQTLFLQACAVEDGGKEKICKILQDGKYDSSWFDPHPFLQTIQTKITIAHGREDGVIPFTQAQILWQEIHPDKKSKFHVTGLYHHTGPVSLQRLVGSLLQLPVELWSSIGLVRSIARVGGIL
jgi:hypothetical protein